MSSMIAGVAIKAAIKPIIKQVVKRGVTALLKKSFRKLLLQKVKKAIINKIKREAQKKVVKFRDEMVSEAIKCVTEDDKQMSDLSDKAEEQMGEWVSSVLSFSAWDLVPGLGEVRMIQQMMDLLSGSRAKEQSNKIMTEMIEHKVQLKMARMQMAKAKSAVQRDTVKVMRSTETVIAGLEKHLALNYKLIKSRVSIFDQSMKLRDQLLAYSQEEIDLTNKTKPNGYTWKEHFAKAKKDALEMKAEIHKTKQEIRELRAQKRMREDQLAIHGANLESLLAEARAWPKKGDSVRAWWKGNPQAYANAIVVDVHSDKVTVTWGDGDSTHRVVAKNKIKAPFKVGDRVRAPLSGKMWNATVAAVGRKDVTVNWADGDKAHRVRPSHEVVLA